MNLINKIKSIKLFFVFALIILLTAFGLNAYNNVLKYDLAESTSKTLEEILQQQKFNFQSEINSEVVLLKSLAINLLNQKDDREFIISLINQIVKNSNFDYITITNTNGMGVLSNGQVVDISNEPYFHRTLQGETVISGPIKTYGTNQQMMNISTPLIKDGEVAAILMGSYNIEKLSSVLLSSFEGKGYAFVVNNLGEIISRTHNAYVVTLTANLFESWENAEFYDEDTLDDILNNVRELQPGHTGYIINGEDRITHYAPVGINDWYIFVIVPETVVGSSAAQITTKAGYLAFAIINSFMLFIIYIFSMENKSATMRQLYINELERVAYYDELTGIGNFNKFKIDAQRLLEEYEDEKYMIVKLDVENFKLYNEMHSFSEGDRLLKNIATALGFIINTERETFARIAVDEFVILFRLLASDIAERRKKFELKFYELMGLNFPHIIIFPTGRYNLQKGETNISKIYEKVNFAHRKAKETATKTCNYDNSLKEKAIQAKEIENSMEKALKNGEFILYLQPKYRLRDETIVGAEALVRWKRNDIDLVYPGTFIPIFEKNGFITKLDMYMLEKSCQVIRFWLDNNITPVTISVNFSRLHINKKDFVSNICKILDQYQIPRNTIELELTETAIFDNVDTLKTVLAELHSEGLTFSMDDFGTGYSSLGLLKNLPVDVIKIDRSFFVDASDQNRSKAVIETIINMTKKLQIHTVAEGVEDREHIDLLRELGCDIVQGYFYAKPMPHDELTHKLRSELSEEK